MKLSIVIPVFNEERTILEVLDTVRRVHLPDGWEKEIIVVDDGSTDRTRHLLQQADFAQSTDVTILLREKNEGKGAALKLGFSLCTGDYIIIQDADLEYDPKEYSGLIAPITRKEIDIVFGSRNMKRGNTSFNAVYFYGGAALTKVFNLFFGTRLSDITTCYKVFPRSFVPRLAAFPGRGFSFDAIELTYALAKGRSIIEVPITYATRTRKEGKKLKVRHGIKCILSILEIKTREAVPKGIFRRTIKRIRREDS